MLIIVVLECVTGKGLRQDNKLRKTYLQQVSPKSLGSSDNELERDELRVHVRSQSHIGNLKTLKIKLQI